jgi:hypothetical protein
MCGASPNGSGGCVEVACCWSQRVNSNGWAITVCLLAMAFEDAVRVKNESAAVEKNHT